jgi:hypothetical protein
MAELPTILPYPSIPTARRPRLVGLYVLAAFELLAAIAVIGAGILHAGNLGTRYQTPLDRPVMVWLLVAGGGLFLAALASLFWRLLPWLLLIGLQIVAAICQLPGIREGRLEVADATRRGGDWGALSVLGAEGDVAVLSGSLIIAVVLLAYLIMPGVRRAFSPKPTEALTLPDQPRPTHRLS